MGAQKDSNLLPGLLVYKLSSATGAVQQLPDFSAVLSKSNADASAAKSGRLAFSSTGGGSSSTCSGSSPVPRAPQQQQQPSRIPTFSGGEQVGKADPISALGGGGTAGRPSNASIAGATPPAASCSSDFNGFPATLPHEGVANSTAAPPAATCSTKSTGATSACARSLGYQLNPGAETVASCQNSSCCCNSTAGLNSGSSSLKRPCTSHDPSTTLSRGPGLPIQPGQARSSHFSCNGSSSSSRSILNSHAEPCTPVKTQKGKLPLQRLCVAISTAAAASIPASLPLAPAVSAHKTSNKAEHSSTTATSAQSAPAAGAAAAAAVGAVPSPLLLQHLQLPSSVKALLALPHSQSQQRYRERQRVELYALNTIMAMSEDLRRNQQLLGGSTTCRAVSSNGLVSNTTAGSNCHSNSNIGSYQGV